MFLCLLQLVSFSYAFPWNGPAETTGKWFNHDSSALGPKPTAPPRANLKQRQAKGDSTCGFYNATSSDFWYCLSGTANVCATDSNNGWGCCASTDLDSNCYFETACIDSTALSNFNSTYLATANVWVCGESTAAYCTTDYLEANGNEYTAYGCYRSSWSDTYYTTYLNGTTPGTFTATLMNGVYVPTTTSSSSSSSSSLSSSSSSPNPTPPPPPLPSSTPPSHVGAIAGGVVGGVSLILIVGIGAFCIFRRSGKQSRKTEVMPYNSEHQRRGGPPLPLTQHQSTQDGNYQHSHAQPTSPMVEVPTKPTFTGRVSQVTSPTSERSSSGPFSYTSESKHEERSVLGSQHTAVDDSQMRRDGGVPELSSQHTAVDDSQMRRDGGIPELDGRIYRDYERY